MHSFKENIHAYVCRVCCAVQVAASAVTLGQHVLVRPGEQVPLDGIITWGTANLSLQVRDTHKGAPFRRPVCDTYV